MATPIYTPHLVGLSQNGKNVCFHNFPKMTPPIVNIEGTNYYCGNPNPSCDSTSNPSSVKIMSGFATSEEFDNGLQNQQQANVSQNQQQASIVHQPDDELTEKIKELKKLILKICYKDINVLTTAKRPYPETDKNPEIMELKDLLNKIRVLAEKNGYLNQDQFRMKYTNIMGSAKKIKIITNLAAIEPERQIIFVNFNDITRACNININLLSIRENFKEINALKTKILSPGITVEDVKKMIEFFEQTKEFYKPEYYKPRFNISLLPQMDLLIDKILGLLTQLRTNLTDSKILDMFKNNFEEFINTYYPTDAELNMLNGGSKRKTKKRKTKKRKTRKQKRRKSKRRYKH